MSIVINLLMVLLVALCLLMLLIILMQRPKQEGLGAAFGGGMMDGMLGAGTTNFLQKGTVYLTVGYFIITMTLAVIQARTSEARSLQGMNLEAAAVAEAVPTEATTDSVAPPDLGDGGLNTVPEENTEEGETGDSKPSIGDEGEPDAGPDAIEPSEVETPAPADDEEGQEGEADDSTGTEEEEDTTETPAADTNTDTNP